MGRMRRALVGVAAGVVGLLGSAGVAHADPAGPTDYASEVVSIEPATPTIDVRIVGGDSFVMLTAQPGTEVVVLGYSGEPYLRFRADGVVEENRRSPTLYQNKSRYGTADTPAEADADRGARVARGGERRELRLARPPCALDAAPAADERRARSTGGQW